MEAGVLFIPRPQKLYSVAEKYVANSLATRSLKFEVVNLELPQRPESVTKVGEW